MATESIFASVIVDTPEGLENFVNALEASEREVLNKKEATELPNAVPDSDSDFYERILKRWG